MFTDPETQKSLETIPEKYKHYLEHIIILEDIDLEIVSWVVPIQWHFL